jgi:hypothetical protein
MFSKWKKRREGYKKALENASQLTSPDAIKKKQLSINGFLA